MAKDLKSILAGVKSSKIAPPDIDDKNLYQWNAKDGVAFIKKHEIETHADRAGNGDDVYKGKTKKTDKYKFQTDGVYEESEENELDEKYMGFHALKGHLTQTGAKSPAALAAWIGREKYGKEKFQAAAAKGKKLGEGCCNHTMEGVMCEVHGESACPTKENDVNMQKKPKKDAKGREYLADKKKTMDEGIRPMRRSDSAYKDNPRRLSNEYPKSFRQPGTPSKAELRAQAAELSKGVKVKKIKEEAEYIEEKLSGKDPVSKWIHDFVHSDNPKFDGKSTKERQKMALGAYYGEKRGKTIKKESATNTDYTGPGAAGWTTGRHDMGTL